MGPKEKSEYLKQPRKWNYDQFKAYLLLLSYKPEATLFYHQSPETIQVTKVWHEFLNQMRDETKDKYERYAVIGCKPESHTLYLPSRTAKGDQHQIPTEIILSERIKAYKNDIKIAGDIHSHPKKHKNSPQIFSTGDLYIPLVPSQFTKVMCLVEYNKNLLVLTSRETEMIPYSGIFPQKQFVRYWEEQSPDTWNTTMKIAQRHKLAIYSGKINEEFRRIAPKI